MLGIILITITALMPLFWWWPWADFSTTAAILISFGQAMALSGIVLLCINFVLAGRFFWVEQIFKGLNKIYVVHHSVGAIAFAMLLFHPAAITFGYILISASSALWSWAVVFGILALLVLSVILIITLFMKLPYHIWKNIHQYIGSVLFLAGTHGLLIGSTLAVSLALKIYIFGWITIAILSYLIRLFNLKLNFHQYDYKVFRVKSIGGVTIVKLTPLNKALEYKPGQFVFIRFKAKNVTFESHPFSLCGNYRDKYLTIAAKSLGDYTNALKELKIGELAKVEGSYGRFNYENGRYKKQIWIAGGIGVTPFRGMAMDIEKDYKINLFYSVSEKKEAIFDEEFKKNRALSYELWVGSKKGRITAEYIKNKVGDLSKTDIFICGPVPMMKDLASQFNKVGVKNSLIHTEEFKLYN